MLFGHFYYFFALNSDNLIYFIIIVYSSFDIYDLILIFLIFRNHMTLLKKGKNRKETEGSIIRHYAFD